MSLVKRKSARRPGALGLAVAVIASSLALFVAPQRADAVVIRSFAKRFNTRTNGDITMIANSVQKCPTGTTCTAATNNNNVTTAYIDVDSDATTFNSSSSTFALPTGATVLFAGLYWGGDPSTGTGGSSAPTPADKNKVKLKVPGATAYQTVVASTFDQESATSEYQSFADITSLLPTNPSGSFTLANLQVGRGVDREGGWAIVFVLADPTQPARDLSVFDGFASVTTSDTSPVTVNVSGLLTPPAGPVKTRVGAIAYEGDAGTTGDFIKLNGTLLSNGSNPSNNFFNSSSTVLGTQIPGDPLQPNTLGFDADIVQADGILANNATTAAVTFETGGDFYYPGALTFVTDLYAPKLDASKVGVDVNGGTLEPGDLIEYSLTIKNNGQDPSLETVLTDPIPSGTTFEPGTLQITAGANAGVKTDAVADDQANYATAPNRVLFRLGTSAAGTVGGKLDIAESTSIKFRVRVDANIGNGVAIQNKANLSYIGQSIGGGTILASASTIVATQVILKADLTLTKTHTGNAVPGTNLTYNLTATNAGPHASESPLTVTDTLPTGFTYVTGSATNGFICSGAPLVCAKPIALDATGAGASTAFAIGVAIDPTLASGTVTNTAVVSSPTVDPVANNTASDPTTIERRSDLVVTKTDGVADAVPGSPLVYTVKLTNNGPSSVTNASVTDNVPAAITGVSWTCATSGTAGGSCSPSGTGNAIATTATLPAGGVATYTITGTLKPTTPAGNASLSNTATAAVPSGTTETNPGDESATDVDNVTPKVNLGITKTDAKTTAVPGTPISYTIKVTNTGPSTATNATVTDTIAAAILNPTWTCAASGTGATCGAGSGTGSITSTVTLPTNTSATYIVSGVIDPTLAAGNLVNKASVAAVGATDTDSTNNSDTDTDTLVPTANLTITKTDGLTNAVPGEAVSYTIVIGNEGPSTATNAEIADIVPADIMDPTWTCVATGTGASCATPSGTGSAIATTATLPANTTATITVTGTLDPATAPGTSTLSNTATVTLPSGVTDPTPGITAATDTDNVTPKVDLGVSKTDGLSNATPGTEITYTITVSNAGPSTATNAAIVDNVPTSFTGVTWTCATTGAGATCAVPSGSGNAINTTATLPKSTTATITVKGTLDPATASGTPLKNIATATPIANVTDTNTTNNEGSDIDTVTPSVDLSIVKTASSAKVVPGSNITYTITVSNAGPSTATAARITDNVPAPLTGVTWTCVAASAPTGSSCSAANGSAPTNAIDLPVTVAPGGSVTLTIVATVPATTPASTVTNNVTITPANGTIDTAGGNNNATVDTQVQSSADLKITKTNNVSSVTAGSATTYQIVVTNLGPSTATGASIIDSLPGALTNANWTCVAAGTAATCGAPSGSGSISTTANLGLNATATFTVTATVNATATGTLSNTAIVNSPGATPDPATGNNSATDADPITLAGNLAIAKTLTSAAIPGANVSYQIVASNSGPSVVVGAVVTDTIPASLSNATWTCVATNAACPAASGTGNLSATVNIGSAGSVTFTVTAKLVADFVGSLANTATIAAPLGFVDGTVGDDTSTATITPTPTGDLGVTKTNNVTTLIPGSPVSYTIVVTNSGPSSVNGVTMTDNVPASIINVAWTCAVTPGTGSCSSSAGSGNAISTPVTLGAAASATFTVTGTVDPTAPAGPIANTATITAPLGFADSSAGNNSATDTDQATPTGDVSISKDDAKTTVTPGASNTWDIVVSNNGPSTVANAAVQDTLPAGLLNATWTCAAQTGSGTCTSGSGIGNVSTSVTVPAGGSILIQVTATIDPALHSSATSISNTATIMTPVGFADANNANNTATDTDTLTPTADLKITKDDGVSRITPGLTTTYTITVENAGPSTAVNARIDDVLPSALTNASWTCATLSPGARCANASGAGSISETITIPSGATVTFTLTATVDPALPVGITALTNTATVTGVDTVDPDSGNNTSTDVDEAIPLTDLAVSKSNGAASVIAGKPTSYTIVVSNNGPSVAKDAEVVDAMPAWLINGSWSCAPGAGASCATGSGSGGINTLVTIPVGSSITFIQQGVVSPAATADGTLSNTVKVTPGPGSTNTTGAVTATDDDIVKAIADVAVTKDRSGQFVAGTNVTYTVVATNFGPSDAPATVLTDNMPADIASMTWTCTGSCNATSGSGNINETIDLAVDSSATYTITALLNPSATSATNTATVKVSPLITDPVNTNDTASTTDQVGAVTDLRVKKSHVGPLVAGLATTYTIVVTNDGPSYASGTSIVDRIAAGVESMEWTCSPSSPASKCAQPSGNGAINTSAEIASGESVTLVVTVLISPDAIAPIEQNVAVAATPVANDPNPDNNTYTDTANVIRRANVSITKDDGVRVVVAGTAVTYTIKVSNTGPSTAADTRVVDAFPPQLENVTWECDFCGIAATGAPLSQLVTLPPGKTATFIVSGTVRQDVVPALGALTNTASATTDPLITELDPSDNVATDADDVIGETDVSISKTGDTTVVAGTSITYTIKVVNNGPSMARGVRVSDTMPSELTNVAWSCVARDGATCTAVGAGDIDDTIDLPFGAAAIYTITATVKADTPATTIKNVAWLKPDPSVYVRDARTDDDESAALTDITREANISTTKTHSPAIPEAGRSMTYTITVSNSGPSTALVRTLDAIPAALTGVTWTCTAAPGSSCGATTGSGNSLADDASLDVTGSVTYVITGTVSPAFVGALSNTATSTPLDATDADGATGTDNATVVAKGDLTITKTNGVAKLVPGMSTTYTVTVSNIGPADAVSASIVDTLPGALIWTGANVSWTCTGTGCAAASGVGALSTTANIAAGSQVAYEITGVVNPTASGSITNTATVTPTAAFTDTNTSNNEASDTDLLTPTVDLKLTKTNGVSTLTPGLSTSYTIVVTNIGPSSSPGTRVLDTPPTALRNVTWTCGGTSCATASGANSIDQLLTLASGATVTYVITGTVASNAIGTIRNTATVFAPTTVTDLDDTNNTETDTDTLIPKTSVAVTKTNGVSSITAGLSTTYTIVVSNTGPSDAGSVSVADSLPAALDWAGANASWTCLTSGGSSCGSTGTGSINDTVNLPAGAVVTYTLTATVDPSATGSLVNTAAVTVSGLVTDSTMDDDTATDTDPIEVVADLAITKTDGALTAIPGTPIVYTITVTNAGPSTAVNAHVVDTLPVALLNGKWTCIATPGSSCGAASGAGSIDQLVTLASGGTISYLLGGDIDPKANGTLDNTATVTPAIGTTDPTPVNLATDSNALIPTANLAVAKTNGSTSVVPGTQTTYSVVFANNGPSFAPQVKVADLLPASLLNATWTCTASGGAVCAQTTGTGGFSFNNDLPAGGLLSFTITADVAPDLASTDSLVNTATAEFTTPGMTDPDPLNDSATDTDSVTPIADVRITKTNNTDAVVAGTAVTYTITVRNAGPSSATSVRVIDTLPASLLNATWTCSATGGTCVAGGSGSINQLVSLSPDGVVVFTVRADLSPTATGTLSNTATVTSVSDYTDPDASSDEATDADPIEARVALSVTKSDGKSQVVPGATNTYTVVARNDGSSTTVDAKVLDVFPGALTNATWTCVATSGSSCVASSSGSTTKIDQLVTLAPGGRVTYTVTGAVNPRAVGSLTNSVSVTKSTEATETDLTDNRATDVDTLVPTLDLAITKTNGATAVVTGRNISWTIDLTGTGLSWAPGTRVVDTVPASVTNVTWTCVSVDGASDCASLSGTGDIDQFVDVAPNGHVRFVITGLVADDATGRLANTAAVTAPTTVNDPDASNNSDIDDDPLTPVADLVVTKTNNAVVLVPGTPTTYVITVTNTGPSKSIGAHIVDTLPVSLLNATWTCASAPAALCNASTGSGSIDETLDLPVDAVLTYTVTADIDPVARGNVANSVASTNKLGTADPTPLNSTRTDSDPLVPTVALAISKSDGKSSSLPGTEIVYAIKVTNAGPSEATDTLITDVFPAGLLNPKWTCQGTGVTCPTLTGTASIGETVTLPVGSTIEYNVIGQIDPNASATFSNTASLAPGFGITDTDPLDNTSTDTNLLAPTADLQISKSNGGETIVPGTSTSYVIDVINEGPSIATATRVRDQMPTGMINSTWTCKVVFGAATCPGGAATASGSGDLDVTIDLGVFAHVVFTVTGDVIAGATGRLINTATVTPGVGVNDPSLADNSSTDDDELLPTAALSIAKTDNATTRVPGKLVDYTIEIHNSGPSIAPAAHVIDTLPASLRNAIWTCVATGSAACANADGVGSIDEIVAVPVGGSITYTLHADIDPNAVGTLTNSASVDPGPGVLNPIVATSTDTSVLTPTVDLKITKDNGRTSATAGSSTQYVLVVTNAGPSTAKLARVVDSLGAELEAASWTCTGTGGSLCAVTTGSGPIDQLVTVAVGGEIRIVVDASVRTGALGSVTNTASVAPASGTADTDSSNNSATDVDEIPVVVVTTVPPDVTTTTVPAPEVTTTVPGGTETIDGSTTTTTTPVIAVIPDGSPAVSTTTSTTATTTPTTIPTTTPPKNATAETAVTPTSGTAGGSPSGPVPSSSSKPKTTGSTSAASIVRNLSGTVFFDKNSDGRRGSNENPIAGATIIFTDTNGFQKVVTSDAEGRFATELPSGEYSVEVRSELGTTITTGRFVAVAGVDLVRGIGITNSPVLALTGASLILMLLELGAACMGLGMVIIAITPRRKRMES
jgi:uncharacterized repeat protein (TIGR01451 family)